MQIKSLSDISTLITISIKANNPNLTNFLIQSIIEQRKKNDFSIKLKKINKPLSSSESDDSSDEIGHSGKQNKKINDDISLK